MQESKRVREQEKERERGIEKLGLREAENTVVKGVKRNITQT